MGAVHPGTARPTDDSSSADSSSAATAERAQAPRSAGRRRGVPLARGAARCRYRLRAGRLRAAREQRHAGARRLRRSRRVDPSTADRCPDLPAGRHGQQVRDDAGRGAGERDELGERRRDGRPGGPRSEERHRRVDPARHLGGHPGPAGQPHRHGVLGRRPEPADPHRRGPHRPADRPLRRHRLRGLPLDGRRGGRHRRRRPRARRCLRPGREPHERRAGVGLRPRPERIPEG